MRDAERPRTSTERVTMVEAGEELSRRLEMRGRKKSHRMTVASDLRNHIAPFFGATELDRIEPRSIERYIALKLKTLAPKTVRNHLNTMHSVFELGMRMGWCQRNPVKLADRPIIKTTETRIKFLDQPELEKLLALPYPDDAFGQIEPTLYLTAAMTGLRQGELIGLRWRDVDFDARKVRVVSPYVRGEFNDPKSEDSGRSVPMAKRVADALTDLRDTFKALSADALKQSAPEFLRLAEQSLGKFQEAAKGDLAQRQEAIKGLVEPLKQQLVVPGVQVPVEEAQIVADDVIAIVGELDALPLALGATFALHTAHEDLARHQFELFELGKKLRIEQRFVLRLGHVGTEPFSATRVDHEFKTGQQARGVSFAVGQIADAPLPTIFAMDAHLRPSRIGACVDQPVFLDRRHLQVQLHVTNRVLFGIVNAKHFDDQ